MFSLCRLCATCTDPIDLNTDLSELEPKLAHCFGWRKSEKEIVMPKKVCNPCVDRLQQSSEFFERILSAEKQLNKLLHEQMQTVADEFLPEPTDIKFEDSKRIVDSPVAEIGSICDASNSGDEKSDKHDDQNDAIFSEPIDFSDAENSNCSQKTPIKKAKSDRYRRTKQRRDESFLDVLNVDDRLDGGLISPNGVKKLEKLFPIMKSMSWQDCEYKCEKCNRIFKGSINFYSHIRSVHIEDIVTITVVCVYCDSKHRREFTLHRHMALEHFRHLKYRYAFWANVFYA